MIHFIEINLTTEKEKWSYDSDEYFEKCASSFLLPMSISILSIE